MSTPASCSTLLTMRMKFTVYGFAVLKPDDLNRCLHEQGRPPDSSSGMTHCRERAWKLQQAKKFARHAQRSDMDIESRAIKRQRQEQQAIRKLAAGIAKEVSQPCAFVCVVQSSGRRDNFFRTVTAFRKPRLTVSVYRLAVVNMPSPCCR